MFHANRAMFLCFPLYAPSPDGDIVTTCRVARATRGLTVGDLVHLTEVSAITPKNYRDLFIRLDEDRAGESFNINSCYAEAELEGEKPSGWWSPHQYRYLGVTGLFMPTADVDAE